MRPLDELAKQAQELNMGYEKPITCAEAGRKGGSARSAKKTAANRANAKLPRKKAVEIISAPAGVKYWKCPHCAFHNGPLTAKCFECGKYPSDDKQPAKWIEEASASARAMVNETARKAAKALLGKQNARQSRLRPKVGQVWTRSTAKGRQFVTVAVETGWVFYRPSDGNLQSEPIPRAQWLADRKAGVIRIVRASK